MRKELTTEEKNGFYTLVYTLRDLRHPQQRFATRLEAEEAHELAKKLARPRKMQPYIAIIHMTGER